MLVVVIPTKNRRALLERALGSAWAQDYAHFKVVVINDGSTDDTAAFLTSQHDPRLTVIAYPTSRGVNAARNAAFKTLQEGEWAVPLDDDDFLLPGALARIASGVASVPPHIQVVAFNTRIRTAAGGEFAGGYNFAPGEAYYDPTYRAIMTGENLRMHPGSENRPVFKWTLFPKYLFQEEVNGFEGEWWQKISLDGVGVRYLPGEVIVIDWAHQGEHLSDTAARRNPRSFARAHRRIFAAHAAFFAERPDVAKARAWHALKTSLRAWAPGLAAYFAWQYARALVRSFFGKQQADAQQQADKVGN